MVYDGSLKKIMSRLLYLCLQSIAQIGGATLIPPEGSPVFDVLVCHWSLPDHRRLFASSRPTGAPPQPGIVLQEIFLVSSARKHAIPACLESYALVVF